jgi:hypothetical protein
VDTNTSTPTRQLWAKYRQLTSVQQVAIGILFFLIPLIVVEVYSPLGIFIGNQHLYYLRGLYEAGVEYLQNDPDAMGRSIHFLFTKLVYVLYKMDWLAGGSQFLCAVFLGVFGIACVITSIGIVTGWRERQKRAVKYQDLVLAMTIAALFAVLINRTPVTDLNGIASMSLLTNYFQASLFAVFIMVSIGFMSLHHWRAATVSLLMTSLFHTHYLTLCGPLMLIMLYETYRLHKLREGLFLFGIFVVINLPMFIIGPLQWSNVNDAETIHILNFVRSPHHSDVAFWWNEVEMMRVVLMGLATILALWKLSSVLANIMWMYFAYTVVGILVVWLTGNDTIAALLPWRSSAFILPLSELIIVATVVIILFELTPVKIHTPLLVGMTILALAYWIMLKPWQLPAAQYNYTTPEIRMVREHTQTNDVIVIPPRMDEGFRFYSQRPIFVLWKTTSYDVAEWYNRTLVADEMMIATIERQHELCAEYTFAYYLLPVNAPAVNDVTPIASTDNYLLVACPT